MRKINREHEIDMLRGCKNRLCVSVDKDELNRLRDSAIYHIENLYQLRLKELEERESEYNFL